MFGLMPNVDYAYMRTMREALNLIGTEGHTLDTAIDTACETVYHELFES